MVQFIAEVSGNHHRQLDRCLEFVDVAAEIGCYGIKFQLFKVEKLFAKEILDRSEEHRRRIRWELPIEFLPLISKRCKLRNIKFGCTPFYLDAVTELAPYVDFYKIASYELLWHALIEKCAMTDKPLIISTGMAEMAEIKAAINKVEQIGCVDITLLHCVSGYPTPINQCNLAAILTIGKETGLPIGWSDHSVSPTVIYRAVHKWNATIIEFHLDLDKKGEEYKFGHCWMPEDIAEVISITKGGVIADGSGEKKPLPVEVSDRHWRTDSRDGLRPMRYFRNSWQAN